MNVPLSREREVALLHQTTTMNGILDSIGSAITTVSDFVCGYPLFILLIGGGLFLFFYSGAVSLCRIGYSIKALRYKSEVAGEGQISSFQALMSAIASTVGMGNIAGVAIAITVGGPGAIFWMWVSAVAAMLLKYAEVVLAHRHRILPENRKGGRCISFFMGWANAGNRLLISLRWWG